ncbi:MAG: hypothetical protein U5K54_02855 [Cytophagales bacterium]|nr:hypothetical protein [Cytophagales bacterium]
MNKRMMTTIHQYQDEYLVITKGPLNQLFQMYENQIETEILAKADVMAEDGMRTLAYACKLITQLPLNPIKDYEIESDLRFLD